MSIKIIILAAGKGTRMKSSLPKVLHPLAGKSLLGHVLDASTALNPASIAVVVGHGADQVRAAIGDRVEYFTQTEQLGTAHAVQQALPVVSDEDTVLIGFGDVPLTSSTTLHSLITCCSDDSLGLLTVHLEDPTGYGRIVRNTQNQVVGIVEQKDASEDEQAITEINSGILTVRGSVLTRLITQIRNDNAQQEYYLPDLFALAVNEGLSINTVHPEHEWEVAGVNSRLQLAELERIYQQQQAIKLMEAGVTLHDPSRIDIRGEVTIGEESEIDINAVFVGNNTLGKGVRIGPNCVITDSVIGDGVTIEANSVIENAVVNNNCTVGPYARLRPGTQLSEGAKIGNFVEIKNATIGMSSKVNHLSYVGDSDVGQNVNVGAGTITCNYDGANKHRTVMEDGVFIGSNSALVAPVTVGKGATVGAGATISKDVSPDVLVVARARQTEIQGWDRPQKKKKQG